MSFWIGFKSHEDKFHSRKGENATSMLNVILIIRVYMYIADMICIRKILMTYKATWVVCFLFLSTPFIYSTIVIGVELFQFVKHLHVYVHVYFQHLLWVLTTGTRWFALPYFCLSNILQEPKCCCFSNLTCSPSSLLFRLTPFFTDQILMPVLFF